MDKFTVDLSDTAFEDLDSSFEWGCENWGREQAAKWYFEIKDGIEERLSLSPFGYPIAPDADEYDVEVRQMVISRYHIIFNVDGKKVTVLHIRGPYVGK